MIAILSLAEGVLGALAEAVEAKCMAQVAGGAGLVGEAREAVLVEAEDEGMALGMAVMAARVIVEGA